MSDRLVKWCAVRVIKIQSINHVLFSQKHVFIIIISICRQPDSPTTRQVLGINFTKCPATYEFCCNIFEFLTASAPSRLRDRQPVSNRFTFYNPVVNRFLRLTGLLY